MVGMVKNGADDLAAQRKLAVALHNTTGATKEQVKGVESWISKQGVALGVTDDELRPALQRLVQSTGNVSKAQKLAGVAMDASAGSGKSLKVVSEAIAKAHNGNLGALSRLGVKIKDTNGKTLTFNQAMKEMGKTFKGQAAAGANTFDGKMGRLKLMFDETKETIGQALIPMLTKLADWFLKLVKGMQNGTGAGGDLRDAFKRIGDVSRRSGRSSPGSSSSSIDNKAAVGSVHRGPRRLQDPDVGQERVACPEPRDGGQPDRPRGGRHRGPGCRSGLRLQALRDVPQHRQRRLPCGWRCGLAHVERRHQAGLQVHRQRLADRRRRPHQRCGAGVRLGARPWPEAEEGRGLVQRLQARRSTTSSAASTTAR
jgi:hypothetical protein